jgi:hypothetical protein
MKSSTFLNDSTETNMKFRPSLISALLLVSASLALSANLATAQTAADTGTDAASASTQAKPTKAQRKAARQQARAKKNAELKKLENAGYQPARNDPSYPDDIQKAEKKAGVGAGASQ